MTDTAVEDGRPVASVVRENIHAMEVEKAEHADGRSVQEKAADALTRFSGSMIFVWSHAVWFGVWIGLNLGVGGIGRFDPFPFGFLTMIVSLEAIFLSTFVLISQNKGAELAERRAELDLQTNLLAEHELTRVLRLTRAVAEHLGIALDEPEEEIAKLEEDTRPGSIVAAIKQETESPTPR